MHPVKCSICGKTFDRDRVPCVKTAARRYAEKTCYDAKQGSSSEDEAAHLEILAYTKKLFKDNFNKARIELQLTKMINDNHYSYTGILRTLIYWYEVKKGDVSKSNYSLGIIPYVYNDAYNYYYSIWQAQQNNAQKNINEYLPKQNIIKIKTPTVDRRIHKHFTFLDEERSENE